MAKSVDTEGKVTGYGGFLLGVTVTLVELALVLWVVRAEGVLEFFAWCAFVVITFNFLLVVAGLMKDSP